MIDWDKIKLYPISERDSKIQVKNFSDVTGTLSCPEKLCDMFPNILAGSDIKELVELINIADDNCKPIIAMIGGHVIKCGLAPLFIFNLPITHVAMNSAASIHDLEIALFGETSESVEDNLPEGKFGMWQETLEAYANSLHQHEVEAGLGECLKSYISEHKEYKLGDPYYSILEARWVVHTVHAAYGADIIHQNPKLNPLLYIRALKADFNKFVEAVACAFDGGVVLNIGCATLLPEVFLKAMNLCVNQGYKVNGMVCANFDMIHQYRAVKNVVERPRLLGASTYNFICQNEIMIPLLAYMLRSDIINLT